MGLMIHGKEPFTVFHLNGTDENGGTFALGWLLEKSLHFRMLVIDSIFPAITSASNTSINLQKHDVDNGYTDIEIQSGLQFYALIEAKRWWTLPSSGQLTRYLPRLKSSLAKEKKLVSISMMDQIDAKRRRPTELESIEIVHLSWNDLKNLAIKAQAQATSFEEKLWIRQLVNYLQEFVSMERQIDNQVFVVSLGSGPMVEGGTHTWIDVVTKDQRYFHPIGNNWPTTPPNYIGFRYYGKLQSVHHIEKIKIVEDLSSYNPLWLKTDYDHFVYHLGPPMYTQKEIKTGKIFRNGRVRCAIDTLLSGKFLTISDARDETQKRLNEN